MKERPILFSTEMVKAILEGRKTQTRRVLKTQLPFDSFEFTSGIGYSAMTPKGYVEVRGYSNKDGKREYSPFAIKPKYGEFGDILWVRETFEFIGESGFNDPPENPTDYLYKADSHEPVFKWSPSIYMPKEACRIKLKITEIRIERLLDISKEDAIAEGITGGYTDDGYTWTDYTNDEKTYEDPRSSYMTLWDSINGKDSHRLNPWVWVISFEKYTDTLLDQNK